MQNDPADLTETIVWIPVAERLPDRDLVVLIYPGTFDDDRGHIGYLSGNWFGEHASHADDTLQPHQVTHWAMQPKGPRL